MITSKSIDCNILKIRLLSANTWDVFMMFMAAMQLRSNIVCRKRIKLGRCIVNFGPRQLHCQIAFVSTGLEFDQSFSLVSLQSCLHMKILTNLNTSKLRNYNFYCAIRLWDGQTPKYEVSWTALQSNLYCLRKGWTCGRPFCKMLGLHVDNWRQCLWALMLLEITHSLVMLACHFLPPIHRWSRCGKTSFVQQTSKDADRFWKTKDYYMLESQAS